MTSEVTANLFAAICEQTLGFVHEFGFAAPSARVDAGSYQIIVCFEGRKSAIECIWDWRQEMLEIKVACLVDGVTSDFAVDDAGRLVRDSLSALLMRSGVRHLGFSHVSRNLPLPDRWRAELEDYAKLLRTHGSPVLTESGGWLDCT